MKKILLIAAIAAMALFTGCKKQSEFNKALNEDYAEILAEYPGAILFEAETEFNDVFTTDNPKDLKVVKVREVFQVYGDDPRAIFVDRDFVSGTRNVMTEKGHWAECVQFTPNDIHDVKDALKALLKSDIKTPDSKFMTLRNPLGPEVRLFPLYIFGSNHFYVAVNAGTLEVSKFE